MNLSESLCLGGKNKIYLATKAQRHEGTQRKTIKMKKSRQNKDLKNQIMLPKAMPLGWVMLPLQGENGFAIFYAQGDAIGLGYSALSGRKWFGVFLSAQGDAIGLGYSALSGRKWLGVFLSALKGQYTLAQRQRLGKNN